MTAVLKSLLHNLGPWAVLLVMAVRGPPIHHVVRSQSGWGPQTPGV